MHFLIALYQRLQINVIISFLEISNSTVVNLVLLMIGDHVLIKTDSSFLSDLWIANSNCFGFKPYWRFILSVNFIIHVHRSFNSCLIELKLVIFHLGTLRVVIDVISFLVFYLELTFVIKCRVNISFIKVAVQLLGFTHCVFCINFTILI